MTDSMHRHTPSLTVFDGRGLTVRQTAYYRAQADADAQACVNVQEYDSQGRAIAVWDPRLFELRSKQPDLQPNLATVYSLSGAVLSSHSVDAGAVLSLSAESGAVLDQWDARATHWQTEYDDYPRPIAVHEQMAGEPRRTCERFIYGGSDGESALHNQCGQLIRVDDGAGTLAITEYGLLGGTLREERRLLSLIEPPDWPLSTDERDALLESGQGAITQRQFDASGSAISTTDARGHLQSMRLNIAGQLAQVTLTLKNSSPQLLLRDVQYNANEQITSQTAGNGVISHYLYNPGDGRLRTLKTIRSANDPLQLLTYDYDPVGNVTSISDDAQAVRHFANQRIEPINRYTYDSFYQLVEAQGRETAKVSSGPQLPDMQPLPIDSSQWLNFTERYRYDAAGNLTQLRHEGSQSYTRDFEIDRSSNRALVKVADGSPPDFANGFDANGNLQRLSPGRTMFWDARNRLSKITPVSRRCADDDAERYVYDSSGQRVRKIGTSATRAASHTREARYFPGLELRSDSANDEQLEVIVIQAGRCKVRCLHWLSGRPADIENDQLRYSVDDHLGSSTLELDSSARLISHEGYYPFGGTAWWAARSSVEAKYKVVRYSGKERDASGLYYYGLRYYAPWLMRWVNPDPGGAVDGLNLYVMVRNNPIRLIDSDGRQSMDGLTILVFTFAMVMAFAAGVFYNQWQNAPAAAAPETGESHLLGPTIDKYGLIREEISLLQEFTAAQDARVEQVSLQEYESGAIYAFSLKTRAQRRYFSDYGARADFIDRAGTLQIPFARIRRTDQSEIIRLGVRRASLQEPLSSGGSINTGAFTASAVTAASSNRRSRTVPSQESQASALPTHSSAQPSGPERTELTVDSEGFLEDPAINQWLNTPANVARNMRAGVSEALDNFDPSRRGHQGLRGMSTVDIKIAGNASGRGDYRLGFTRTGNVFRPEAVLTHKGKGKIEVRRRRAE